ncbi:MAG: hypothetical protein V1811_01210 [Candidatus Micrarchaeota archaeon]
MKKRAPPLFAGWQKKFFTPTNALLLLLFLSVVLYHYTYNLVFGFLGFGFLIAVFVLDLAPKKTGGAEDSLLELIIALAFAAAAWFLLSFLLNTATPMSVVVSCSMQPTLDRGDLVFVQGSEINVPHASVEAKTPFQIKHEPCTFGGVPENCSKELIVGGKSIPLNKTGDILVLEPTPAIGDCLVHRAVLRMDTSQGTLYLTKGDNNPILDQESKFEPVPQDKIKGKVVFRIPLLGYVKLLLFMQFQIPEGCGMHLQE